MHLMVALLIAVFAIGAPLPVQADCYKCEDCTAQAPAKNDAPCPEKGLACQIAQSCASQVQKAPAQAGALVADDASIAAFGYVASIVVKSTFITPETAPPRL